MTDHTALVARLGAASTTSGVLAGLCGDALTALQQQEKDIRLLLEDREDRNRRIVALKTEIESLVAERDRLRHLIEANFDCLPGCSSYGHEENCPAYVGDLHT